MKKYPNTSSGIRKERTKIAGILNYYYPFFCKENISWSKQL